MAISLVRCGKCGVSRLWSEATPEARAGQAGECPTCAALREQRMELVVAKAMADEARAVAQRLAALILKFDHLHLTEVGREVVDGALEEVAAFARAHQWLTDEEVGDE